MTEYRKKKNINKRDNKSFKEDFLELNKTEVLTTDITKKTKNGIFKVVKHLGNKTIIDFNNFGVYVEGIFTTSDVNIEYVGEIGDSDFKIINVKEM